MRKESEQAFWDTEDLFSNGKPREMFVHPIGVMTLSEWVSSYPKDCWETNLILASQIEAPNDFVIRDIQAMIYDKDGPLPVFDRTGVGNLWAKTLVQLWVLDRLEWCGSLWMVADPICVLGGLDAILREGSRFDLSDATQYLHYQQAHPLDIAIGRYAIFRVRVSCFAPLARRVSVRLILNGTKYEDV